jgi:hypothetical protein
MSGVLAPTKEAKSSKGRSQQSAPSQEAASTTVMEHVLSRLKDLGISKVFGVAGDFAFPIEDAIVGFPGIDWVGCCNELNAGYAADGHARARGIATGLSTIRWEMENLTSSARWQNRSFVPAPSRRHSIHRRATLHHLKRLSQRSDYCRRALSSLGKFHQAERYPHY